MAAEWPTYGYRRITAQLHRQGWQVNHKRVQRLMRLMGLQAKIKRRKRRTTNSEHDFPRYPNLVQGLEIVHPDQVWVSDITYIRLRYEFVYLAVIMDVFTRSIRGWHLGRSLDHTLTLTALQRALARHPAPEIHHSDQGVQYAAPAYTQTLLDSNVQISMADVGEAWQNGYAERLIRTIKELVINNPSYLFLPRNIVTHGLVPVKHRRPPVVLSLVAFGSVERVYSTNKQTSKSCASGAASPPRPGPSAPPTRSMAPAAAVDRRGG